MVRDNWFSSVTWEDWEAGVREHVDKLMARKYAPIDLLRRRADWLPSPDHSVISR
jgi:hypothetical protein